MGFELFVKLLGVDPKLATASAKTGDSSKRYETFFAKLIQTLRVQGIKLSRFGNRQPTPF